MRRCIWFCLQATILLSILLSYSVPSADAKHLVGGSLTYDYLGKTPSGDQRYRIQMRIYRDARPPTTAFDRFVEIGVYEDDVDLSRDQLITINYDTANETKVSIPSGGSNCSFSPGFDFRQAIYETTITLPPSQFGYHLAHPRCCRNAPANLVSNMGQWYYAFIPPTKRKNTSPDFNSVPAPYICVGDTIQISYQTFEPDGDSLAYKLVDPYTGGGAPPNGRPKPGAPNTLPLPLSTVDYKPGYSSSKPFGNNGLAKISSTTGIATFSAPVKGRYAIAVEIQEYRNGKLISSTRRDVQIIVIDCPKNSPPESNIPPTDSNKRNFTVVEGNQAKFSAKFTDDDPMSLGASGGVFEEVSKPRADYSSKIKPDSLQAQFRWQTACYHGREPPYVFNFRVRDSGCPPKTTISTFQVRVIEYPRASIKGPDNVCQSNNTTYRAALGKTGSDSVEWRVSGGRIIRGQQNDTIKVDWKRRGLQTITAISTNINGCNPDTAKFKVRVFKPPYGAAGPDTALCGSDTIRLGPSSKDSLNSYSWPNNKGLGAKRDTANPTFTSINNSQGINTQTFNPEIQRGVCTIIDTVNISIQPKPSIRLITGDSMPCLQAKETYTAKTQSGIQFEWYAKGGNVNPSSNLARVTWTDSDSGWVAATTTNVYGCQSDTFKKPVDVINPVLDTILGTEVVCPNSENIRYWVDSVPQNTYKWEVKGGSIASGQGFGQIRVDWGDSGSGYVQTYEKTPQGCFSDTVRFPIQIAYRLETSPILGDTNVCEQSSHNYNVRYTNGSSYEWWVDGGQGNQQAPGNKIDVNWGETGIAQLAVLETSYDSVNDKACIGDTIRQEVVLNRLPDPGPIQGPDSVCQDDTVIYHVQGFDSSEFVWDYSDERAERISKPGDSLIIYLKKSGTLKLSLQEVTKDSCLSRVKKLPVTIKPRPKALTIIGSDTVCSPSGNLETYRYEGDTASSFQWDLQGGFFKGSGKGSSVTVRWANTGTQRIKVREFAFNGCSGPEVFKNVTVDKLGVNIKRVTTLKNNPDQLKLKWEGIDKRFWNNTQTVERKPKDAEAWSLTVDGLPPNRTEYIDKAVNPNRTAFSYQVVTRNLCKDIVSSKPHQAVWLKGQKEGERSLNLNWTPYRGWLSGVQYYEVMRRTTDTSKTPDYKVIQRISKDKQQFKLESPTAGATQCYRVRAVKQGGENKTGVSWSNEICENFPAFIFIPNAFSPWDDNGVNDMFKVVTANLKSFKMSIFNRWGEKMFESKDPEKGWDGFYNGKPAPVGTYLVRIKFRGNGSVQSKSKTFRLLR